MRQVIVGLQQIKPGRIDAITEMLTSRSFAYWAGYPSIISEYCGLASSSKRPCAKVPVVFLGAEGATDAQRQLVQEATGATVTDQYGFAEAAGNASRCPAGHYHEDWELGFLECKNPETLQDGSVRGSILATGFWNLHLPFIRYEVGDVGVWAPPGFRCPCGRSSRVLLRIEGRSEDYVATPDGRRIMRFAHVFRGLETIREGQVVQTSQDSVEVRVALHQERRDAAELRELRGRLQHFLGSGMDVSILVVDSLPRTSAGKFRAVVGLRNANSDGD